MKIKGLPSDRIEAIDKAVVKLLCDKEWLTPERIAWEAYVPRSMARLWLQWHRIEGPLAYLASPPPPAPQPEIVPDWKRLEQAAQDFAPGERLTIRKLAQAASVGSQEAARWLRNQRMIRLEEALENWDVHSPLSLRSLARAAQVSQSNVLRWAREQRWLARAAATFSPDQLTLGKLRKEAQVSWGAAERWLKTHLAGDPHGKTRMWQSLLQENDSLAG